MDSDEQDFKMAAVWNIVQNPAETLKWLPNNELDET